MNTLQRGFWSGLLANGPMTLTVFMGQRMNSELRESPLPPAILTKDLTEPVQKHLTPNQSADLTLVSHMAYGVACAEVYAFAEKHVNGHPVIKGTVFGVAVWAASYLGWIPALGLRPTAPRLGIKRDIQFICAHLAWGASLGLANDELKKRGNCEWSDK